MIDPTPHSDTVTVYSFRVFNPDTREMQTANCKATLAAIAALAGAEHMPATAEQVPSHALDTAGRFRRVATGWGDLA